MADQPIVFVEKPYYIGMCHDCAVYDQWKAQLTGSPFSDCRCPPCTPEERSDGKHGYYVIATTDK